MIIEHTFKGMLTGEVKTITNDDATSPSEGYTPAYINNAGKGYEADRAQELLGDYEYWEHQESKLKV